jgi:hypothetical protein
MIRNVLIMWIRMNLLNKDYCELHDKCRIFGSSVQRPDDNNVTDVTGETEHNAMNHRYNTTKPVAQPK